MKKVNHMIFKFGRIVDQNVVRRDLAVRLSVCNIVANYNSKKFKFTAESSNLL